MAGVQLYGPAATKGRSTASGEGSLIYVEATIDPGNLADAAGETQSVTVPGAALGDVAFCAAPYDLQDLTVTAYVQAADTVEIRIQNESTGAVNLASGTWRVGVLKLIRG